MQPLLPWLAQAAPNFYRVHGTDYIPPNMWINGNPPLPSGPMTTAAVVTAVVLLAAVVVAQRLVPWGRLGRTQAVVARTGIILGFFTLWELGLQVCAHCYHEPTFVADPVTFWKLNPALASQLKVPDTSGDQWWERGVRPIPDQRSLHDKPPGCYRLMFFGESQLVSIDHVEVDVPHSYPHVLQQFLATQVPGRAFDVINAGVPGFSSWQALMLCRQLLRYRPDLVIFAVGYHDCSPAFARDRDVLTDNPWTHATRSVLYRSELFLLMRKWVVRMRESEEERNLSLYGNGPTTMRVPPDCFEDNLRSLVRLGQENGFRVCFMLQPIKPGGNRLTMRPGTYQYHEVMRRVAKETGTPVLDVFSPMMEISRSQPDLYWNDGIHMSRKGHEVVAGLVLSELQRVGIVPAAAPSPLTPGSAGRRDASMPATDSAIR